MKVRQLLGTKGREVVTTEAENTVEDAIRSLQLRKISALVVADHGRPVGIFTERDVLIRVVDEARDPAATRVAEVMTGNPVVVTAAATINEAMAIVTEKRCRHLPVVDEGKLLGLVSAGDLTYWVTRGHEYHIQDLVNYITGKYPV